MAMVAWPSVYWERAQDAPMEILLQNDAFHSVCDPRCNDAANRRLMQCHAEVRRPDKLSTLNPLGLELQITPTLVNSIQDEVNKKYHNRPTSIGAKPTKVSDLVPNERLKAASFNALAIQIGSWKRRSVHENDLVAKIYFAKRKLVWEFLQNSRRKSKIEMQWSDIIGIRATMEEDQPGVLEVELANPPSFQDEQEPQPRKHTTWQTANDFTDGYASNCRRHLVTFPQGAMDRHIQKLFVAEPRLLELSRQGFPTMPSPYFDMRSCWPTHFSLSGFNGGYQPFGFQELDQNFLCDKKVYENPPFVTGSRSYSECLSGGQVHGISSNVVYSSSTSPALYHHLSGGHRRAARGGSNDPRQLKATKKHLQSAFENVLWDVEQSTKTIDPWNAILNLAREGTQGIENRPHYEHSSTTTTTTIDHNASGNENVLMILDSQCNQTAPSHSQVQPMMMMHQNRRNLAYDPNARAPADYSSFDGDGEWRSTAQVSSLVS